MSKLAGIENTITVGTLIKHETKGFGSVKEFVTEHIGEHLEKFAIIQWHSSNEEYCLKYNSYMDRWVCDYDRFCNIEIVTEVLV